MAFSNRPVGLKDDNFQTNQNTFLDEEFRGEYSGVDLIYKGFAKPGASVDEAVWQIAYLTYDGSDNILSIQWPLAPVVNGTSVSHSETLGTVTTPWNSFSGTLSVLPIVKGTVVITVFGVTFTDVLMNGTLTGSPGTNSGTINYGTGAIALTINPAFVGNHSVTSVYSTYPLGGASNDYQFVWSERHSYTYV